MGSKQSVAPSSREKTRNDTSVLYRRGCSSISVRFSEVPRSEYCQEYCCVSGSIGGFDGVDDAIINQGWRQTPPRFSHRHDRRTSAIAPRTAVQISCYWTV